MIRCADQLIASRKQEMKRMIPFILLFIGVTLVFPKAGPWVIIPMMVVAGGFSLARHREIERIPCPSCDGPCRMETDRASVMKFTCEACGETHDSDCVYYRGVPRRRF
ncbi:hypothetical protein [Luteolibacter sp. LG18]|uniref:hypothetical protein n=1 Tax=Luteolibacter sp. LG18 TaxID=2819286 RepID=UPI002B28A2CA|nr:hypothetical protein llg_21510 [Luteolibacter sp. LG18]